MDAPKQTGGGRTCSVRSCNINSRRNPSYSFFSFPKEETRVREWIENCDRRDLLHKDLTTIWRSHYVPMW
ncbi:THAP domain [Popillia japonica]|uniref:THAP domain n=1 Tax=Popillia japonica TaxID=7064 RepID=A0AAW1KG67_POPJA